MIQIKKLSKSFGKTKVLNQLSCQIDDNCIYGLVGANGAGKSTLLRILIGIYQKEAGSIQVDGKESFDDETVKQKMVFVPDDLYFPNNYTLLDYAQFYESFYPKFDKKRVRKLAEQLHLDLHTSLESFSKGMRRQCALICALATNAQYYLFDETFDGLDPVVRNFMKKQLANQMRQQKMTIIMTSHNLRELEDICDHLGLLYQGGILFESEIDQLKTNMYKVQISFKEAFDETKFKDFHLLSYKKNGSVATLILQDEEQTAKKKLKAMHPLLLDFLPLTLEEVFIYEMEVLGYAFENILSV